MKRVLHVSQFLDIGGLERMILLLSSAQRRHGLDARVFAYERSSGDLLPQFQAAGVPVTFWAKGPGFSPRLLSSLRSHLLREKIGIVHSHDLGALLYSSLVKLLMPGAFHLVHTQHSFQHLSRPRYRIYERIFPHLADRIVCVSEDLRRTYLRHGVAHDKLRIVPNGVEFHGTPLAPTERKPLRERLLAQHRFPPELRERKWILVLGRVAPVKGTREAIECWQELPLPVREHDAVLFIVGPAVDPAYFSSLGPLTGPGVCFAGATLEPESWLRASDLYFSASRFEGLPLAALEAIASKLPMLLSRIPGHGIFQGWAEFFPGKREGGELLRKFLSAGFSLGAAAETTRMRIRSSSGVETMCERYVEIYKLAP